MDYSKLIQMRDPKELASLIRVMKEDPETHKFLYDTFEIYVIVAPKELGGTPLSAHWSRTYAERLIKSLEKDSAWKKELEYRKKYHMEPLGNFEIVSIPLSCFSFIGE